MAEELCRRPAGMIVIQQLLFLPYAQMKVLQEWDVGLTSLNSRPDACFPILLAAGGLARLHSPLGPRPLPPSPHLAVLQLA